MLWVFKGTLKKLILGLAGGDEILAYSLLLLLTIANAICCG